MRTFAGPRLLVATHNPGKAREVRELLAPLGYTLVAAADVALPEPEETGATLEDNAALKAVAGARHAGFPAIADDAGLFVDALGGEPGVLARRYADEVGGWSAGMLRVDRALVERGATEPADRGATLRCALAVAWPDGHVEVARGDCRCTVVWPPRGDHGYGYDAILVPEGWTETLAEVPPARREAHNHRAAAFALLRARVLRPS